MKVKFMDTLNYDLLEEAINNFIKDKKVIDIKYQELLFKDEVNFTSVMIMYEE